MASKPTLQVILGVVLIINGLMLALPLLDGDPETAMAMLEVVATGLLLGCGGLFVAIGLGERSKRG